MSASTEEATLGVIKLRGSVDTVVEFFVFAINSILYQRGVYPHDTFKSIPRYGLPMLVTTDSGLQGYLAEVATQLKGWMSRCEVRKLVVVVASQATGQTLERWAFDVKVERAALAAGANQDAVDDVAAKMSNVCLETADMPADKTLASLADAAVPKSQADNVKEQREIQAIIRQICASVTFLPLLEEACSFDILIYTDKEAEVPASWGETDPKYITGGSQEVKLRSFTTKIHKVEGSVAYKFEEACGGA